MGREGSGDRHPSAASASASRASRRREGPPGAARTEGAPTESRIARAIDDGLTRALAAIVRSSDAAIIGKTLDGVVTSWNAGAERLFGYAASEMVGRQIQVIAAPGRAGEMAEILRRIRAGERVEPYETERRRKDGRIVRISLAVSPVYDETGRIVGASKIAHDLADRLSTEAQLRAKSEQLEQLAHAIDLAPAMVRTLGGRILRWGRGLETLYGWTPKEAVGRISYELLATEFRVPLSEIESELIETGEWQGELVHRHRDGRRVVVASQWALHRDAGGNPVSVLKLDWDMTETRRAQSMLKDREERLRSVLETAPDAIITIDRHGLIQSFSTAAEQLFGYVAGEVVGRNVSMLMPPPHREQHDGYLDRYLRTGEKRIIGIGRQVEAQRKDGTTFPMELAVGEVKLGETHIFTGFIRDLTTRVKMEQDLRQAQKMEAIGQLTGGVAHDFNNLLTVISGNLEMLGSRLADRGDREILAEAREAAQLAAQLSSRLLAFGRRQSLRPEPIDLGTLVEGMIDLLRRSLGEVVAIETRLAARLPRIMADPGQVENALLNLAVNARDAMPGGGRLVIETALARIDKELAAANPELAPGRYVTLSVTDTGIGMAPEIRQRAFEPFYTTKGPSAGTGLGLSMVYGFVKQSGGHVQLCSEPGRGTTVRLYLPARGEATPRKAPRAAAGQRRAVGGTILVVEDDARVRRVSARRLKALGYGAIEADSGPAALRALDSGAAVDLLFTDVVMAGGMTGLDLAREARRRRPGLKILFTSGYAEPAIAQSSQATQDAGWLGKPYGADALAGKLAELLAGEAAPSRPSPRRRRRSPPRGPS